MKRLVVEIDDDTHKKLREFAAKNSTTLKAILINLLDGWRKNAKHS